MEYGGLRLLVPLTKSSDPEVQRLAAHALANLSVDGKSWQNYNTDQVCCVVLFVILFDCLYSCFMCVNLGRHLLCVICDL